MKKYLLVLTLAILSLFTISCAKKEATQGVQSSVVQDGDIQNIKIIADKANVRSGCSANAPILQASNKNTVLNVINEVADWYAVKLPDNQIGFVPKSQSKPVIVDNKNVPQPPAGAGAGGQSPQETTPKEPATPQGNNTAKTPDSNTNTNNLSEAEQQMIKLVNEARAQNNVPPLKIDYALSNVARTKAQDMIDNNYFSHTSPKYGSPFDMMKSFGIKFIKAGENIAGNQTVEKAQNALMNSPGHRKNILSPDFTHIGIGIREGGPYGNMFSQMFISK